MYNQALKQPIESLTENYMTDEETLDFNTLACFITDLEGWTKAIKSLLDIHACFKLY